MHDAPPVLLTARAAAAADQHTMGTLGVSSVVLMERASLCVAHEIVGLLGGQPLPVMVLVGPGNNGGDGLAVARILDGWGIPVQAVLATPRRNETAEHQLMLAQAHGVVVGGLQQSVRPERALVVDALLGTGSEGAPRGPVLEVLRWQAPISGPRVAVDVPTGIDVDTGRRHADAFVADLTVTFVRSKPGLHLTPGREAAGRVVVAEIGIVPAPGTVAREHLIDPSQVARALVSRPRAAHKGQRGHLAVLGGSPSTPGAAVLAATAAMRVGAGITTIVTSSAAVREQLIAQRPELMVAAPEAADPFSPGTAWVVGPGLTHPADLAGLGRLYLDDPRPALWDASALDEVPLHVTAEQVAGPRILTPHPGEAARMLHRAEPDAGWDNVRVQSDRLDAARRLAAYAHGVVVLKGEGTVVSDTDGDAYICVEGSSALATAGSGDVLAGIGGGLLARGFAALDAARLAVHVHAIAGDLAWSRRPLPLALDICDAISSALVRCAERRPGSDRFPRARRG